MFLEPENKTLKKNILLKIRSTILPLFLILTSGVSPLVKAEENIQKYTKEEKEFIDKVYFDYFWKKTNFGKRIKYTKKGSLFVCGINSALDKTQKDKKETAMIELEIALKKNISTILIRHRIYLTPQEKDVFIRKLLKNAELILPKEEGFCIKIDNFINMLLEYNLEK